MHGVKIELNKRTKRLLIPLLDFVKCPSVICTNAMRKDKTECGEKFNTIDSKSFQRFYCKLYESMT